MSSTGYIQPIDTVVSQNYENVAQKIINEANIHFNDSNTINEKYEKYRYNLFDGINEYDYYYKIKQYDNLYRLLNKDIFYNSHINIDELANTKITIKKKVIDKINEMLNLYSDLLRQINDLFYQATSSPTDLFLQNYVTHLMQKFLNESNNLKIYNSMNGQQITFGNIENPKNFKEVKDVESFENNHTIRGLVYKTAVNEARAVSELGKQGFSYTKDLAKEKYNTFANNINAKIKGTANPDFIINNNDLIAKIKQNYDTGKNNLIQFFISLKQNNVKQNGQQFQNFFGTQNKPNDEEETQKTYRKCLVNILKFNIFVSFFVNINKYIFYLSLLQNSDYSTKIDEINQCITESYIPGFLGDLYLYDSIKVNGNENYKTLKYSITQLVGRASSFGSFDFKSSVGNLTTEVVKSVSQTLSPQNWFNGGNKTRRRRQYSKKRTTRAKKRIIRKSRKMAAAMR
jgi:hypothetical protein